MSRLRMTELFFYPILKFKKKKEFMFSYFVIINPTPFGGFLPEI